MSFIPIVKLKSENACHYIASTPTLILYALQGKLRITNVLTTVSRKISCQLVQMVASLNELVVLDEHFCTWHTVNDVDLSNSFSYEVDKHDRLSIYFHNVLCASATELLLIKEANSSGHQYRLSLPNDCAHLCTEIYVSTENTVQEYDLDFQLKNTYQIANVVAFIKTDLLVSIAQEGSTMTVYSFDKQVYIDTVFVHAFSIPNYLVICCKNKILFIHRDFTIKVDLSYELKLASNTIYNDQLYIYLLFPSEIVRYEIQLSLIQDLNKIIVDSTPFSYASAPLSKQSSQISLTPKHQRQTTPKQQSQRQSQQQQPPQSQRQPSHQNPGLEEDLMKKVQKQIQEQQVLQNAKYESFLKVVSQSLKQGLSDSFEKFSKSQPQIDIEGISDQVVDSVNRKLEKTIKKLVTDSFIPKLEIIVDHLLKQVDRAVEDRVGKAIDQALKSHAKQPIQQQVKQQTKPKPSPKKKAQKEDLMQILQKSSSKQHLIEDSDENDDETSDLLSNKHFGLFIQSCLNSDNDSSLKAIFGQSPDEVFNEVNSIVNLHFLTWLFDNLQDNTKETLNWIRKGILKINAKDDQVAEALTEFIDNAKSKMNLVDSENIDRRAHVFITAFLDRLQ